MCHFYAGDLQVSCSANKTVGEGSGKVGVQYRPSGNDTSNKLPLSALTRKSTCKHAAILSVNLFLTNFSGFNCLIRASH